MGIYSQEQYNDGVVTGFAEDKIKAWHQGGIDLSTLIDMGRAYNGPVPPEVAERLVGWEPVVITPQVIHLDEDEAFVLPDRLSKFIGNPNTGNIVNVVGSGYVSDLHITMRQAIEAAMDASADIASVVSLGDGAHMGMSFRARDGVVIGGDWGGAIPYVGYNSSLTGAIATSMDTGTTLRVCDNTMQMAASAARRSLRVKRTRWSGQRITAASVREALDIAFEDTGDLIDELERLANIDVSAAQLAHILDEWKPVPDEDGRGRTIALDTHMAFLNELSGPRNPFGATVAGLWQAHNTYAHWGQTMRNVGTSPTARLDRMAVRTMTGNVRNDDAEFMSIVSREFGGLLATV